MMVIGHRRAAVEMFIFGQMGFSPARGESAGLPCRREPRGTVEPPRSTLPRMYRAVTRGRVG